MVYSEFNPSRCTVNDGRPSAELRSLLLLGRNLRFRSVTASGPVVRFVTLFRVSGTLSICPAARHLVIYSATANE